MEAILRALRAGASLHIAADHLGIPYKTILGWLRRGEEARTCERRRCRDGHHGPKGGEVSYETFAVEVQKARGDAALRAVGSWTSAFTRDPYLAVRYLAKAYPDDFGARAELPKATPDAGTPPLVITVESSSAPPPEPPGMARPTGTPEDELDDADGDDDDE